MEKERRKGVEEEEKRSMGSRGREVREEGRNICGRHEKV